MRSLLLLCFSTLIVSVNGQTFEKVYGGTGDDEAFGIDSTHDQGFLIVGHTTSFGVSVKDVYLSKLNAVGDTVWTNRFGGGTTYNEGYAVSSRADSTLLFTGFTPSFGATVGDMLNMRVSEIGSFMSSRRIGGGDTEAAYSLERTIDNRHVMAGYTGTNSAGLYDMNITKIFATGGPNWSKSYGTGAMEYGYDIVAIDADTGFCISGVSYGLGAGNQDWYVVRTNSIGDTIWTRTYGGTEHDLFAHIDQTTDGGFVIAGHTESFGAQWYDPLLIKVDMNGDLQWVKMYSGTDRDEIHDVKQTIDGGYIMVGFTGSFGAGGRDGLVIRTDSNGDTLWTKAIGGINDDEFHAIELTTDTNYVVVGYTESYGAGGKDVYALRIDDNGNGSCNGSSAIFSITTPTVSVSYGGTVQSGLSGAGIAPAETNVQPGLCDPCGSFSSGFTYSSGGGLTIDFTDTTTNSASWSWDFGDGSPLNTTQNPSYTYPIDGFYTVCLTVSNGCAINVVCIPITVGCPNPDVGFEFTSNGLDVSFTDTSMATSPSAWSWNFGDATTSPSQNAIHTYSTPDTFYVCLTVTDACGMATYCDSIIICPDPIAGFVIDSVVTMTGYFTDTSSIFDDILWDFGDGNFSNLAQPAHTYSTGGEYEVCLTATNACGQTTVCDSVWVTDVGIDEAGINLITSVFPNPSDGIFTVTWDEQLAQNPQWNLFDVSGREVEIRVSRSETGTAYFQISDTVQTGSYYLKLTTPEGSQTIPLEIH